MLIWHISDCQKLFACIGLAGNVLCNLLDLMHVHPRLALLCCLVLLLVFGLPGGNQPVPDESVYGGTTEKLLQGPLHQLRAVSAGPSGVLRQGDRAGGLFALILHSCAL